VKSLETVLSRRSINLDITYRCTLECPKCLRRSVPTNNLGDLSLESFNKIISHFDQIEFCGQISDPIFHPQFIEFLKLTTNKRVFVHTAASHKSMDWYMDAFSANKNAIWEFGIDGLPQDSHKYRINQNGEYLFKVMKAGVELGNDIRWQYIIFKYNENDITQAIGLAQRHKIPIHINKSSRWSSPDDPYKPSEVNCA
jgi:MoaA/NifB/PqqE/SkfB family radical SAM enzyme